MPSTLWPTTKLMAAVASLFNLHFQPSTVIKYLCYRHFYLVKPTKLSSVKNGSCKRTCVYYMFGLFIVYWLVVVYSIGLET